MTGPEIVYLQNIVKRVPVGDHVIDFAAKLARATRPASDEAPEFVKEMVGWGAGPRAGISLISAAKAHAVRVLIKGFRWNLPSTVNTPSVMTCGTSTGG